MRRRALFLALALLGLLALLPLPASAQAAERCFPQTGYCISGAIRSYWERNGGLAVFGYPIGPVADEFIDDWEGPAQWFERDRLEDHANQGLGVLAGRLGAQLLEMQGRPWQDQPSEPGPPRGCRYFIETGHSLCGAFRSYWERNGGLARFGYPLTAEVNEQVGGWRGTVQYFERRRMEYHPENAGTKYAVLLGLLGRVVGNQPGACFEAGPPLAATAWAYRDTLGCAYPYARVEQIAYEPFERGAMLWVPGIGSRLGNGIVVITRDPATGATTWRTFNDTWRPEEPERGGETPPAGLYEPIRGFGKLWREQPDVRSALGWATAPELAEQGVFYSFQGGLMVLRQSVDRVHLLFGEGSRAEEITRLQ
ncbi:MAG: hypothetical protein IPO81_22095 [Kouleothrix sp.]|nr:hypothetical protein [Kouleothrix sp.]